MTGKGAAGMDERAAGTRRRLSVAERKRRQRRKLRQSGLTSVEVWIPGHYRTVLRRIERLLRNGIVPDLPKIHSLINRGEEKMDLKLLRESLDNLTTSDGFNFTAAEAENGDAIEVVVEDRQEFPIMVWLDGEQVLCVTYLWDEAQVKSERRTEMLSTMLEMNVPLTLSSFGKIGDRYVLFGALSASSSVDDVITELEVLSENTLEAIDVVSPFLSEDS